MKREIRNRQWMKLVGASVERKTNFKLNCLFETKLYWSTLQHWKIGNKLIKKTTKNQFNLCWEIFSHSRIRNSRVEFSPDNESEKFQFEIVIGKKLFMIFFSKDFPLKTNCPFLSLIMFSQSIFLRYDLISGFFWQKQPLWVLSESLFLF